MQNAIVLNNKAMLNQSVGRYTEAEKLIREAIAAQEASTRKKKADTKSFEARKFLTDLAFTYQHSGNLVEAEKSFLQIKEIFEKKYLIGGQTNNPDYANLLNQIALLYIQMNKLDQVEPLLQKSAAIYKIYLRYIRAGGKLYMPHVSIPNQKTDLGAWHDLSHNLYGMNHEYPSGTYRQQDSIYQYHLDFTQGLFYFLANDEQVPDSIRKVWSQWGTTKDEFIDHHGWPRMIYIRDGRRMISDFVLTEHHTRKDTVIEISDPVGIAFWPPDVHHVRRIVKDGKAYNEGLVFGGDNWKPFQIPYRSLVPKRRECINLMTPTALSSSHIVYSAIRLEWTFMILGQSLGSAASLCIDQNISVQDLNYQDLKKRLEEGDQILYTVTKKSAL